MHLTIVSPFPPTITGIGQYGYHITRALASSGAFSRITVLAGSKNNGEYLQQSEITEIKYCWRPNQLNALQEILSGIKQLRPDLVWFNVGASVFGKSPLPNATGLLAPMLTQYLGYPTVVTMHEMMEFSDLRALGAPGGPFAFLGARWLTKITTQADVVCLTRAHYVNRLSERKIDCVHIPHGAFHQPDLLPESKNPELLLFTTLAPFKGAELLLEALPALKLEYPDLQLTIAGEEHPRFPGYIQTLKNRFADLQGVNWLGKIPNEEVINLFRRAQIVVIPYKASTGASSILYQAAAWGRAVVASDIDEIRTLAHEGNFQIEFFNSANVESLKNTTRALLASPQRRASQVQNNFQAVQNSRIEITCQHYLHAFNRALEKRKSPNHILIPHTKSESI